MRPKHWLAWSFCFCAVWCPTSNLLADDEPKPKSPLFVARTYPVADVLIDGPLKPGQPMVASRIRFQALIEHVRRVTGAEHWRDDQASTRFSEATLSLVVRQTSEMHERIAEVLGQLRKGSDATVTIAMTFVTGPRREIQDLAVAFAGELGQFEQQRLLDLVAKSESLKTVIVPKVTTRNRLTTFVGSDQNQILTHAKIADDRRSVRLKIGKSSRDNSAELLNSLQMVDLHDGRAATVHFESPALIVGVPPADDAEELLVIVSPKINVPQEQEELLGVPTVSNNDRE